MTWVKICGITSPGARDAAIDAGADALGVVMVPESPRAVDIGRARFLIADSSIPCYLLTADVSADRAIELLVATGADGIQPYGAEAPSVIARALEEGFEALAPIAVGDDGPSREADTVPISALPLFDASVPGARGGTGTTFRWELLHGIARPFVLAGGLGPDNVVDAIRTVRPFGVDASSRLEATPGVKDPDTIRAFIEEAKRG